MLKRLFDIAFSLVGLIVLSPVMAVADPMGFVNKLLSLAERKVVVSFPCRAFLRTQQRLLRYWLRGCPLYIYTREGVEEVIRKGPAGLCRNYDIHKIPGWGYDFVVTFEK